MLKQDRCSAEVSKQVTKSKTEDYTGQSESETNGPATLLMSKEGAVKLGSDHFLRVCLHKEKVKGPLTSLESNKRQSEPVWKYLKSGP